MRECFVKSAYKKDRGNPLVTFTAFKAQMKIRDLQPVNPLHLNINMYILHNVLYRFPMIQTRRIS